MINLSSELVKTFILNNRPLDNIPIQRARFKLTFSLCGSSLSLRLNNVFNET
jgi:hypothetical protein